MPIFEIQGPDGKSYEAEADDLDHAKQAFATPDWGKQIDWSRAPSGETHNPIPPTPYTPRFPTTPEQAKEMYGDDEHFYPPYTPQQLEAAKQGVNIDANAGVSTFRANFASQKAERDSQVSKLIQEKFGMDTPIRTGTDSKSGDVEWYDKDAKQWKTAGDSVGGSLVNAGPAAAEVVGAIAANYFVPGMGIVAGGALGAGTGRALGTYGKEKIGQAYGLNQNQSEREMLGEATGQGLMSAATVGVTGAVTSGLPAGLRMLFRGPDVAPTSAAAQSILDAFYRNKGVVDQIDQVLKETGPQRPGDLLGPNMSTARTAAIPDSAGRVNPSAANMINEEMLLNKFKPIADREQTRRLNGENVLELYWQNRVENPYSYPNLTHSNWQQSLKDTWDKYQDNLLGPYKDKAQYAIDDAQQAAAQMKKPSGINATRGGQLVRDAVIDASKQSSAKEDAAWADYETKAQYHPDGGSDLRVPYGDDLQAVQARLGYLQENLPLNSQRAQASRYQLAGTPEENSGLRQADDISPLEQHLKQLQDGIDPTSKTMDLASLDRTIKDLREENLPTAAKDTAMSRANSKSLLGSLVKMRADFLEQPGNEELKAALDTAEAETRRHSEEFRRSFLGDFLSKSGHEATISDPQVLDHILRNQDLQGARQLAQIVQGEPGAKKAILDYTMAYYNKNYTKIIPSGQNIGKNILDPARHAEFMRDVYPSVEPFLDQTDKAMIKKDIGGLANSVVRANEKYQDQVDTWNKLPQGQLGKKLASETFVNQFFDPKKSGADTVFPFIRNQLGQDSVDQTRAGIVSELARRARDPSTGRIDVDRLSTIYQPLRDRFQQYFGSNFTGDVDRYIQAARAFKYAPPPVPQYSGKTAVGEFVRGFLLGPLDAESRKITYIGKLRQASYASRLESAMYNPDDLHQLVKDINTSRPDRARAGVALGVGADLSNREQNANY